MPMMPMIVMMLLLRQREVIVGREGERREDESREGSRVRRTGERRGDTEGAVAKRMAA
jgi:hypothetical protein